MNTEAPEGVQAFNFWTLWVMGYLWDCFPKRAVISPRRDIAQFRETARQEGREVPLSELPPIDLMVDTINWLIDEGYIKGIRLTQTGDDYHQMILTERGLRIMRNVPSAIDVKTEPKPLGTLMREAAVGQMVGLAGKLVGAMLKDS